MSALKVYDFEIDVKGLYKRNFWVVKPKPKRDDLYYVLAFVSKGAPSRFFVLTQAEVNLEVPRHLARVAATRTAKGLPIDKVGVISGLLWVFAEFF